MDYELFHDESKVDGFWHGMLLVPIPEKAQLVGFLEQTRKNLKYQGPIGIKAISQRKKVFHCAQSWISIAFAALRSNTKSVICPIQVGKKWDYINNPKISGAKFILFRDPSNFQSLTNHRDYGSKIETTFRIGLKGGGHALGNDENPINIIKSHFDGYEHYHRHIDKNRIFGRLMGLRPYLSISDSIDDRSSNHNKPGAQCYEDCQLIQLTDLLIASFRTALGYGTNPIHNELALPARTLLKKTKLGYARMQNSRWNHSFWMSQCSIIKDHWSFQTLEFRENEEYEQLSFF